MSALSLSANRRREKRFCCTGSQPQRKEETIASQAQSESWVYSCSVQCIRTQAHPTSRQPTGWPRMALGASGGQCECSLPLTGANLSHMRGSFSIKPSVTREARSSRQVLGSLSNFASLVVIITPIGTDTHLEILCQILWDILSMNHLCPPRSM